MFVYVGGIPGVGKTTIVRRTVELAQKINFPLRGLDEKGLLCQITGAKSAEDYAKLPEKIRAEARRKIVDHLYALDEKDPAPILIRDDHFTAPKEDGSWWIRQLEEKDKRHMLAFVVIVAKPQIILQRRINRKLIAPESELFDIDAIIRHQDKEVKNASAQAEHLQIPLKIIENEEGKVKQTSTLLLSFVRGIAKTKRS